MLNEALIIYAVFSYLVMIGFCVRGFEQGGCTLILLSVFLISPLTILVSIGISLHNITSE